MTANGVERRVLAIGEGVRVDAVAGELRARGCAAAVARSLSEVRAALAVADLPVLVILDTRAYAPWRVDALERITTLVRAAAVRLVWISSGERSDMHGPDVQWLPVDASPSAIVAAAFGLLDRGHEAADGAVVAPVRRFLRAATQP